MSEFGRFYDFSSHSTLAIGAASVRTANGLQFDEVLLHATIACYIRVGNSTVTVSATTGIPLVAGEKLAVKINRGDYIAVIQAAAAGTLTITPILR